MTKPPASESRRGFLAVLAATLGAIPIVGAVIAAARAGLAPAHSELPDKIPLCRLDEVPADGAILERAVTFEMRRGPLVETVSRVVFVTRETDDSPPIAMLGECTHLSCPVQLRTVAQTEGENGPLRCPCHGGVFSRTGEVLDGPPPRPLRRLPLDIPAEPNGMIHLVGI